jgi:hypothetical protein
MAVVLRADERPADGGCTGVWMDPMFRRLSSAGGRSSEVVSIGWGVCIAI